MNPMLNYSPTATHECKVCGEEIERTKARLKAHLKRFRADQRARTKRLEKQKHELRRQMKRLKDAGANNH